MRYKSFRIRNFKGIKDAAIDLTSIGGASVFALVGLNESGKTTILEAIHSFSPDSATSELVGGDEESGVPVSQRVPRHLISTFTGDVSVVARLVVTAEDIAIIAKAILERNQLIVKEDEFPAEIEFERIQRFKHGDFVASYFYLRSVLRVKGKRQRNWRELEGKELVDVRDTVYSFAPVIAYFPTFVFDFPKSIFLTERGGPIDQFYRRVFQDILDFDGRRHTIENDIVRRVRSDARRVPWLDFFGAWSQHDDRHKIQHVMDRAGATVTNLVFDRWNRIFHEDARGKEIIITYDIVEGEKLDARGAVIKTNEHDVSITFQIRDGTRRFNVNDRSLGFRWFFAFMLFTQFRVARSSSRPLLFLFDEPASNLHAAAQQKLIESFPEIARGDHTLIYTTHSHYMIEPKWLEQTFIVTNRADAPDDSVLDAISLDDESLDIKVATYRSFVNEHPNQTSYFQPILDRLEVIPAKLDIRHSSIILEGKSDYFILRYAARLIGRGDIPLLPGLGASTFGALAALHVGWNLNFLFVLDGDEAGRDERLRYVKDYGIKPAQIITINEIDSKVRVIEDLLDKDALEVIQQELRLSKGPEKGQIRRFFQERLASDNVSDLSAEFKIRASKLIDALHTRLG